MGDRFVAVDLETTGTNPVEDRVVEIGAVCFDASGRDLGHPFQRLIRPGRPVGGSALKAHGLTDEFLEDVGGEPREVWLSFLCWMSQADPSRILAHHARFEAEFIGRELTRLGMRPPCWDVTCTLALARSRGLKRVGLSKIARTLGVEVPPDAHRALADARMAKGIWLKMQPWGVLTSVKVWDCGIR